MNSEATAGARPGGTDAGRPAPWVRGETLELAIGDVAHGGWCVARDPAGRVVFVRHALPGERVIARITDATAKFARADAVTVVQASPDRVEPRCPHARPGGCGGCDWQHASLPAQRRLKAEVVSHQLRRIAGVERAVRVEPVPGDHDGLDWRTRIRFSVGPSGVAGLLGHRSHEVVDVGECPIAHPLVRATGVTHERWEGMASVEVLVSPGSGERAVVLTPAPGRRSAASPGGEGGPAAEEAARLPAERADAVLVARRGGKVAALRGRGYLRQHAAGRTWRVSAGAFWQVHPGAADLLTDAVLDALAPRAGDAALDLYCGGGLFAGALAAAVGPTGAVLGIESDPVAVRDARHNLRGAPWARVYRGEVAAVLGQPGFPEAGLAVLDPPRTGAGRAVIGRLLRAPAANGRPAVRDGSAAGGGEGAGRKLRRVAYVSCDPATLARDIAIFAEYGWGLVGLRAFDAFPMTHHVECLATLAPA